MRDIFTVMKFTMNDMVRKKSFIVSTIIIVLLIVGGLNIPNIIDLFQGENTNEKILIVDKENIFEGRLDNISLDEYGYDIKKTDLSIDEIKEQVKNDEIGSAILVSSDVNGINLKLIVKSVLSMDNVISDELAGLLTSTYQNIQLNKLELTQEQIASLSPNFIYDIEQVEEGGGNVFAIMLLSILLFYAIYFCAFQVSSSITTEKTSKIIETLVTSTSPKNIVLGKTFGIGLVGLGQVFLYLIIAIITANFCVDKELLDLVFDTSNLTIGLAIITLIYFLLGYFTYAFLYALTGSTVSKPEDIQSANSPIALITIAGFYLAYFTMMNPTGSLNNIAALIPISSPFCMPLRVMMGVSSTSEVLLSLLILIVSCLLIAHIAIKIYTNAIINYGTKFSIKNIIGLYKQK